VANFSTQIEALAGSLTSPSAVQAVQWINDGIKDTVNRIAMVNPQLLANMSSDGAVITDGNGQSIENTHRIVAVRRGSKSASQIAPFDRFDAATSTSLKRATDDHPKYYILNKKLYILPDPANTADSEKGYITAIHYDTISALTESTIDSFPEEFYRMPVLYAAIKVLHEKMVLYADQLPSDVVLPSTPVVPSSAITLSQAFTTLSFPSSVVLPSYVGVAEPSFADLNITTITPPTIPDAPAFVGEKVVMPSNAKVPVYTSVDFEPPIVESLDFTKLKFYIEDEEDPELAASQISKINTKIQLFQTESQAALQKYQQDMQNELNLYNDANAEYQALIQKAMQDAQTSSSREVQEYGSRIQRHAQEVSLYQAKVNSTVQAFATEEIQLKLAKYQMKLGHSVSEYQASVGAVVQKYSADISRESAITQADVQRIGAELQQKSQQITLDLQKYGAESSAYQAEVGALVQKFNSELQKTNTEYQWKAGQMAYLMSEYEKALIPIQLPKERSDGGQS